MSDVESAERWKRWRTIARLQSAGGAPHEDGDILAAAGITPHPVSGASAMLFEFADLPALLDVCADRSVAVLGIEGFEAIETGIRPRLDVILDLSAQQSWEGSIEDARRFVAQYAEPGLLAEIVLDL